MNSYKSPYYAWSPEHDHGVVEPSDDLKSVRKQLDSLASMRLDSSLGPALDRAYEALCRREKELLSVDASA
jgi:hypothetical protein